MRIKERNVDSYAAIDALLTLIERFHQEFNRTLQFIWNLLSFSNENFTENLKLNKNKPMRTVILILHNTTLLKKGNGIYIKTSYFNES